MIPWRRRADHALANVLAAALLGACATKVETVSKVGTVVLLPEKEARDTAVTVREGDRQVVLSQPYAAADLTSAGPRAYQSSPQEVQTLFGPALAALPARPAQFTLYFVEGTDNLTAESSRIVEGVFAEIAQRPVPDIVVIGHTDRVGSDPVNDALARRRAETVRVALIRRGIAPENIVAVGRGKREPAIPTADGVAEPRNRRVEILVR
jgi:outer membrane protein OmpA-like peptidoglycan-associated protein